MYTHLLSLLSLLASLLVLQPFLVEQTHALNCNVTYPSTPNTTYPNQAQICNTFSYLAGTNTNHSLFFEKVADNVNWTIEGTHPLAGLYTNKTVFEAALSRIDDTGSEAAPLTISIINIIGGGDEQWSVEELEVLGICRNGLFFDNRYAWATRWSKEGVIVEARAYLDSMLVNSAITLNEVGLFTYSDQRNEITPWITLPMAELVEASGLKNATN